MTPSKWTQVFGSLFHPENFDPVIHLHLCGSKHKLIPRLSHVYTCPNVHTYVCICLVSFGIHKTLSLLKRWIYVALKSRTINVFYKENFTSNYRLRYISSNILSTKFDIHRNKWFCDLNKLCHKIKKTFRLLIKLSHVYFAIKPNN